MTMIENEKQNAGYDELDRKQAEEEENRWIPFAEEDDPLPGQLSPFASTMLSTIRTVFELAVATPKDFVLDLGCGDGRIITYAAETLGCRGIGVDINPDLIEKAKSFAKERGVDHLVEFKIADFASPDFRIGPATIITTYLLPKALKVIETRLKSYVRKQPFSLTVTDSTTTTTTLIEDFPPTDAASVRVCSIVFSFGNWKPSKTSDTMKVYLYDETSIDERMPNTSDSSMCPSFI